MNKFRIGVTIVLLGLLSACGVDNENENEVQQQTPQGVLTNQQQQALDVANSIEQTLLDSAEERRKELEAQLQQR